MNLSDSGEPLNILHVEDNKGDVYLVSRALKNSSISTTVTNIYDGESAAHYLHGCAEGTQAYPDLVLLDINLPNRNGDEILKWMKDNDKLRDIPVLVLSSSSAVKDIEKMLDLGAVRYFTKPYKLADYDIVINAIEECRESRPS